MRKLKNPRLHTILFVIAGLVACSSSDNPVDDPIEDSGTEDKDAGVSPEPCDSAAIEIGYEICVHRVLDTETWEEVTVPGMDVGGRVVTKYLAPAKKSAPLPSLFMVAGAFSRHFDFLYQGFPDLFGDLTPPEYLDLILDHETRVFFAGNVTEYTTGDGPQFGFTVWDDQSNKDGTVTYDQVKNVYDDLSSRFEIGSLYFVPQGANQHESAQDWGDDFPIYVP
jgi:hypothetical protein